MNAGPGRVGAAPVALVATTAEVLAHPELDEDLLAPWERRRLVGIRVPARRDDVVAARLLLRLCASRATGLPPRAVEPAQRCPGCGRDGHGRPYLPDHPGLGASFSHADGLAAAVVGPGPVGIDVEPLTRRPGPVPVLRRLLPHDEVDAACAEPDPGPALLRLWVRREALFKAGRDDVPLTVWTDLRRAAVVALAGATGAAGAGRADRDAGAAETPVPPLSPGPAPSPPRSPAPPSGR
ncbi:4'-phosphopantetheinyl transferase superfamily protein [Streptomyces globisporus]|uniref:4'-phosphopantetheinyl transferase family protein n=1 Tax=Streptomyces albovinaceus subgroup TaxID=1482558 RepID=UPI00099DC05C|nr:MULTISPECIES: 4'-phosphopantetheinyl transferase superfamily protein [Streptomyces albovinaceus subgroup]AWL88706.1 4-phosphopantetheinyl transferase [Streptomyces globisporus]PPA42608.1 4-phosphopantetheinyl transferase [Streptomyces griseus]WSV92348.1 4'-phosphopantetheinyl transferase superfamily protein [Streptomyces globisporus]